MDSFKIYVRFDEWDKLGLLYSYFHNSSNTGKRTIKGVR